MCLCEVTEQLNMFNTSCVTTARRCDVHPKLHLPTRCVRMAAMVLIAPLGSI